MKLKAYILHNHAAPIQPASHERDWVKENEAVYANLSLNSANAKGWNLLCPCAFEATWNGGASAEDIDIRLDEIQADAPGFVQSQLGGGLLTFHSGYQFKTEGKTALWVRGPINLPRDGLYPLERLVDTSLLPCTVSIQWQFTRANQTVRFEAGEPFCTIVPYPKGYIETEPFESEVVGIADDDEAYEQELQRMIQNPAVQSVFRRLESTGEQAAVPGDIEEGRTEDITYPPVSCICPTYGRVELLEEAIYSFLQQDYPGPKELIVLNDYEPQTLEFDHPEVCIVNLAQRFKSIGEKYEAAVALCSHTLIFVWHDDDIYLPHRLSFSVANFDQTKGFFKANSAWFWNDGQVSGPERNVFHGGSCWTRDLFAQVQGYPHLNTGYDIGFEQLCEEARPGSIRVHPARPEEVYYVYRWSGTDSYHLSALSQNGQADQEVLAFVQKRAQWGLIKQGQIALKPHWRTDYSLLVHNVLNHGPVEQTEREEKAVPYPPPFYVIPSPPPLADEAAANLFEETYPARISVILPASNESVLLKRTVEQFEATLPANSEVLVVDNGSTDGSADFLVNQERPGVTLIQTGEPLGVVGARNRGLAQAQGEVVVFADAHIDIPCHWWQPIVAALNQPNVGVVGPGIGVMGEPMLPVAYGQRIIADPVLRVEWLSKQSEEPYPVPTLGGGFMAMRHDILKQAGAFDAGMPQWGSEDLELCLRYWLLGYEVWTVPAVTILHYFRQANPYKIEGNAVIHNLLRAALLHFNQERIARVVAALKADANFDQALAYAVDSDVWQQRVALAGRRVWDDDWLFEKFKDSSSV
jgi:glycosyltransferase involved in cell wall biosynthesis